MFLGSASPKKVARYDAARIAPRIAPACRDFRDSSRVLTGSAGMNGARGGQGMNSETGPNVGCREVSPLLNSKGAFRGAVGLEAERHVLSCSLLGKNGFQKRPAANSYSTSSTGSTSAPQLSSPSPRLRIWRVNWIRRKAMPDLQARGCGRSLKDSLPTCEIPPSEARSAAAMAAPPLPDDGHPQRIPAESWAPISSGLTSTK